jgi:hypothetical protein
VRIVNAPLYPFDYAAAVEEIRSTVAQYQQAAGAEIDLGPILDSLSRLEEEIRAWRRQAEAQIEKAPGNADERRRLNRVLRRIARLLVPLNYARGERFDHDPALKFGAVPRLEAATTLASAPAPLKPFLKVGLVRESNKVRAILRDARHELRVSLESRAFV